MGVTGVMTDYPTLLQKYLDSNKHEFILWWTMLFSPLSFILFLFFFPRDLMQCNHKIKRINFFLNLFLLI